MKLAIYTDSYLPSVDGVSAVCQAYARFLSQEGIQCCVFAPAFPGCSTPGTVPISSLPLPGGFQYRLALPFADSRLLRCERAFSPDIIHAHSPFTVGWRAVATARRLRVPLVASFHTNYQADFLRALHSPRAVRPLLKGIAAFYAAADEVWTMNSASASMLRSYGYRGAIRLLPHGSAGYDVSEAAMCKQAVLQQLQPDTSRLLFFVCRANHPSKEYRPDAEGIGTSAWAIGFSDVFCREGAGFGAVVCTFESAGVIELRHLYRVSVGSDGMRTVSARRSVRVSVPIRYSRAGGIGGRCGWAARSRFARKRCGYRDRRPQKRVPLRRFPLRHCSGHLDGVQRAFAAAALRGRGAQIPRHRLAGHLSPGG